MLAPDRAPHFHHSVATLVTKAPDMLGNGHGIKVLDANCSSLSSDCSRQCESAQRKKDQTQRHPQRLPYCPMSTG
jgi:hypothetical protein